MAREICEYDNYEIPKYDPTIPPEERARLLREAKEEFKALIKRLVEEDRKENP